VPVTAEMPRTLVGGPVIAEEDGDAETRALDRSLVTRVLNLTGQDRITANYNDLARPDGVARLLDSNGRLISNGVLAVTDRDYKDSITQLHVGERLFLKVEDADQDTSDQRDSITVEITGEFGERESVALEETLVHSGIFTGSLALKSNDKPVVGNLDPERPVVECYFGDTLHMKYTDPVAGSEDGTLVSSVDVPVVIGTDGLVAAFSKTFNDENLAVETKFHIAESYFELFKSHKQLGRDEQQVADLQNGRRVLREVMEDYPDPKYVPRISYLLGQFSQELEQWAEAIESYELIVRQHAEHSLAPDAQYKLAQCYELSGDFDQALEGYVTLAATYPKNPLIANVMIRICDHFYKKETYDIAAQVGEKFLDKFSEHEHSARIAFRIGQCHYKAEQFAVAGKAFDRFSKRFPDDELCADSLFWSGESYRMGRDNRTAFRRYNNCRWDFPASDAAKYARGRLALPEMLRQFEAEAAALENDQ
jgi:TolA-binding protein